MRHAPSRTGSYFDARDPYTALARVIPSKSPYVNALAGASGAKPWAGMRIGVIRALFVKPTPGAAAVSDVRRVAMKNWENKEIDVRTQAINFTMKRRDAMRMAITEIHDYEFVLAKDAKSYEGTESATPTDFGPVKAK